jgi:hypothetical protein
VSDVGTCGNEKGLGLRHLPNAPDGTASDVWASTAVAVPHGAPGAADVSSGPSPTGTSWSGLRLARQWVKLEPADIDEREEELADGSDEEAGAADLAPPILRGTVTVLVIRLVGREPPGRLEARGLGGRAGSLVTRRVWR